MNRQATVRRVFPHRVILESDGRILQAHLRGSLRDGPRTSANVVAVGDQVRARLEDGAAVVEEIHPRRNRISRADPGDPSRELVLAANLDQCAVVASVALPRLNPRALDRFLVLCAWSGVTPLILINKCDLHERPAAPARGGALAPYADLGIAVLYLSATTGAGIDAAQERLRGRLTLMVGASGVGKSTILNRMIPGLRLRTRPVSKATGKGVHTTTRVEWCDLPGGGSVLDSPGIRSIHPWGLGRGNLSGCFAEFTFLAPCRFADCLHQTEPGCEVRRGVEEGRLHSSRYDSYLRILATLDE